MKAPLIAATLLVSASALTAQTTGVSHPPEAITQESTAAPVAAPAKPSAAVPYATAPAAASNQTFKVIGPVSRPSATEGTDADIVGDVPRRDQQAEERLRAQYPNSPDAGVVTEAIPQESAGKAPATLKAHNEISSADGSIVTDVPHSANEFPAGTELKIRLADEISTTTTTVGTPFHGELLEPVMHDGQIVIPAGSEVRGHVTEIRGGRRIAGSALIHLEPQAIVLPDGSQYHLHAAVIDSDQFADTRVNREGDIVRRDHAKATLAAMSLTTGGAAATGAILGGGVGAVVGAGIGAGVSTVWWLKQDRQTHLPKDSTIVFNLTTPMSITPDQHTTGYSPDMAAAR